MPKQNKQNKQTKEEKNSSKQKKDPCGTTMKKEKEPRAANDTITNIYLCGNKKRNHSKLSGISGVGFDF